MRLLGFTLLLGVGCATVDDSLYDGPTGSGNDIFCSDYGDADEFVETPLSLTGSGRLKVQLIVDKDNPKDGNIIGNASYRLQNPGISGAEQAGTASPLGEFSKTLGPGTWVMSIEGEQNCENEEVIAEITESVELYLCVPLYCD